MYAAIDSLVNGKWVTSGEEVAQFQNKFAKMFQVKFAHMVNSGSSANLVMITALKHYLKWADGDEIIVSPVGFPTTIAPLVQNNLTPVFIDIEFETLLNKISLHISNEICILSGDIGNPYSDYYHKFMNFINNKNYNTYALGLLPIIQKAYDNNTSLCIGLGTHAIIYSRDFIIKTLQKDKKSIKDWDEHVGKRYTYNEPLCYQLFPKTENQELWTGFAKIAIYILRILI
jgi:hypothetical protein